MRNTVTTHCSLHQWLHTDMLTTHAQYSNNTLQLTSVTDKHTQTCFIYAFVDSEIAYTIFSHDKLDSLRWFSQWRSSTPYFWGCTPWGYDLQIWTRPRFLYNASTPKFPHPVFTCSEVIMFTNKQTHKLTRRPGVIFPTPLFWGAHPGGYDPKFELGQDFCTVHRSEVIMLTNKQTQRGAAENIQHSSLRYDVG